MRVIEGLAALDETDLSKLHGEAIEARSAVLVGVFDGVHLGHQRLLHELLELASELQCLPTVVTFRNHPDEVLSGKKVDWLVSLAHRMRLLRRAGVGRVLLLDFDDELRNLSAEDFADRILAKGLQTRGLLLGYDSAIGKDRRGTPERLAELGKDLGFLVRQGSIFEVDGKPVSSSAIRAAVKAGELERAMRMLGRWPGAYGKVVHGDGRGKNLGFPTANVQPESPVLPPRGVYAVEVIHDGEGYLGVANLGIRPTFGDGSAKGAELLVLELHLLDFDGDLYGHTLELGFCAHIRPEKRFASAEELVAQIEADVLAARRVLGP